jgi:plastocyanin
MCHSAFRVTCSIILLGVLTSCGSSTSPSGGGPVSAVVRDGGSGPSGATITLTSAGADPRAVTVAVGQSVTVVNNDSRAHEIASDPHPQHGTCPSIEGGLATLGAGQSRVTHAFANAGTCSYHDHLDSSNNAFKGTITVQ